MARHRWRLLRRTFLKGAGVSLGLPLLDAMMPGRALQAQVTAATAPTRLACLFFPNGVKVDDWFPKAEFHNQTDFPLPFTLEPLQTLRQHVLIFSGLDKKHSHTGDGHYAKTANFLTGLLVRKTAGKDIDCGGASLDQVVAKQFGHLTPLPSLELGTDPVSSGVDRIVGYTRLYGSYISWEAAHRPLAKEIQPRMVYERLFGKQWQQLQHDAAHADQEARKLADRQSLLDLALEDARKIRGRLGRDDQFKLDEYLDAIRAVEKRIEFATKPDPRDWKPESQPEIEPPAPDLPADFREHVRLMLDLMVIAFWTDSTRISTFMFAKDVSNRDFSFLEGVTGGHHSISHHQNDKDKLAQYRQINRWHVEQLAYMLEKMRSIREGEKTLLDHAMVLFGCGMSDGNAHRPSNLPILLAGGGGSSLPKGRYLACPDRTPLCNLYHSMLNRLNVAVDSFGDSTGPLKELEAASHS